MVIVGESCQKRLMHGSENRKWEVLHYISEEETTAFPIGMELENKGKENSRKVLRSLA